MRAYEENEYEDYNDYAHDDERQLQYGEEEEEEEEEEDPKPTKEELEYLELRQKLKETIRKRMKKEGSSSSQDKKRLPNDDFGSFFGPSKPAIAQRVIQESKSFLENKDLTARVLQSQYNNKKRSASTGTGSRPRVNEEAPRVVSESQKKSQKLKDTRDYSFLFSDDAELPASSKQPPPRHLSVPTSDARPAKLSLQRTQVSRSSFRHSNGHADGRPVSSNGHLVSKSGVNKLPSTSKPNTASLAAKRQLGSNNSIGPGRPALPNQSQVKTASAVPSKTSNGLQSRTSNGLQSKTYNGFQSRTSNGLLPKKSNGSQSKISNGLHSRASSGLQSKTLAGVQSKMPNKSSISQVTKNSLSSAPKAAPAKVPSSVTKHQLDPRKDVRDPSKHMVPPKRPIASTKPQTNRPVNQVPSRLTSQDHKIKKRPVRQFSDDDDDDEDQRAISMIRKMFGYDPHKFAGREEDDSDMEANFDEIVKEEKRSARIARKEDEEQLRLIEEEERREQMRRMAKKRKMSHQ